MINDYYNLPFGAQLLLWTTRIAFHGSCNTNLNKYELIKLAYSKVAIYNGSSLLKSFLLPLIKNPLLKIQPICKQNLTDCELNIINCVEEHKKKNFNNDYFIKLWSLEYIKDTFTINCKNLAYAFSNANLITDLQKKGITNRTITNYTSYTIH